MMSWPESEDRKTIVVHGPEPEEERPILYDAHGKGLHREKETIGFKKVE